jgi:tetratricopeptide (TPR) repeat protein
MAGELDKETQAQLAALAARADDLAEAGQYRDAIQEYHKAWQLLPEPRAKHSAAVWILAATADAAFLGGFMSAARQALDLAAHLPEAQGNAFIHMRRGQLLFDQREFDAAADELMRAYAAGGLEIFEGEHEKYVKFLRTRTTITP